MLVGRLSLAEHHALYTTGKMLTQVRFASLSANSGANSEPGAISEPAANSGANS